METKQCPYCLEFREFKFFRSGNQKCKKCQQKARVEKYHLNPEIKTKIRERQNKKYHSYSEEQKTKIKEKRKIWESENREKLNAHGRKSYEKNKLTILSNRYSRRKEKMLEDAVFEAQVKLLNCFQHFHRKNRKNSIIRPLVGCSPEEFRLHIENLWLQGMNWENYGVKKGCWNIDHIIPLSSAKEIEELKKLFHFSNTRPLWTEDNIKKSNK
jgi:hypothetical protein